MAVIEFEASGLSEVDARDMQAFFTSLPELAEAMKSAVSQIAALRAERDEAVAQRDASRAVNAELLAVMASKRHKIAEMNAWESDRYDKHPWHNDAGTGVEAEDSPPSAHSSPVDASGAESDTTGATEATGATGDAQDVRGNG